MNFLALLLGLAIERLVTHLFHLREFRWLDPLFDAVFRRLQPFQQPVIYAVLIALALLLAAPVELITLLLWDELLQIPYFLVAVVVLLFSLGPRDLDDEVDDYCTALRTADADAQVRVAREILGVDGPADSAARNTTVEAAIYVQSNNRIFGVLFWFLVAGPVGAWLFRVVDLMRRRIRQTLPRVETAAAIDSPGPQAAAVVQAVDMLHGLVTWIPARLLGLSYVLAGNFEAATAAWRSPPGAVEPDVDAETVGLLTRVGVAASGRGHLDLTDVVESLDRIEGARALVMRCLWMIWCPVIALLTLYDWLS